MNRIDKLFSEKKGNILSVYFTAGYPFLDSTVQIIQALSDAGADMIEIGIPFSDPMADGEVIQQSNEAALRNGMNLKLLFSQLKDIRNKVSIPLLLMGYVNPFLQFGAEEFCRLAEETGIDGVIIPDLPPAVFSGQFKTVFEKHNIYNVLLISPQSDEGRAKEIDSLTGGFIYLVSSSSVTGAKRGFSREQVNYFSKVKKIGLKNPQLIGFGISDRDAFTTACRYADGAIIGSAFIKILEQEGDLVSNIKQFVESITN